MKCVTFRKAKWYLEEESTKEERLRKRLFRVPIGARQNKSCMKDEGQQRAETGAGARPASFIGLDEGVSRG